MDLLSMLQNAKITDIDGFEMGVVKAVHIMGGKLTLVVDPEIDDEIDPDGGEEEDIPEAGELVTLKAVAGGKA
jgi:hypothetical protein